MTLVTIAFCEGVHMPELMQQLSFTQHNQLEWQEVIAPTLDDGQQALVRPLVAARCDGDCLFLCHNYSRALRLGAALHVVDSEVTEFGARPFAGPFAYGHECVAEVIAVGHQVEHIQVGQRVVVPFSVSCGTCKHCKIGLTAHCQSRSTRAAAYGFGGPTGGHGGMVSDLLRVPFADAMLVPLPAGVSPLEVASASDNLSDAWRTVAPDLRERPGAPVLIHGGAAQSIGLYAAGIAVALGSSEVDYLDWNETRLGIAENLGARPIQMRKPGDFWRRKPVSLAKRYPIAVDASSRSWGLQTCIRALDNGGVCTGVGYYFRAGTPLPLWHMYLKGVRLHIGITDARAHVPDVLRLVQTGKFQPSKVTTHLCAWDDAPLVLPDQTAVKVVLARPEMLTQRAVA